MIPNVIKKIPYDNLGWLAFVLMGALFVVMGASYFVYLVVQKIQGWFF